MRILLNPKGKILTEPDIRMSNSSLRIAFICLWWMYSLSSLRARKLLTTFVGCGY